MGAPRGGTEIEEERKQCGPAASPGSARTQAKRTTERTHRRGQPAHVAGIEATRAGSKIAKPVAKGNRRDRGEKRRAVQARCQPRTTSQARYGQRSIPFAHDITGTGGRGSTRATAGRTTNNNPPPGRQTNLIGTAKRPPTKAKMQSTLDPICARHHRPGRARFHPSHRWTHNKQQPTTGPPNSLHRQQKTPGPPQTNDVVRYPPGGGRDRACLLPRVPGPVPDGP
jgi:hypothetical protein